MAEGGFIGGRGFIGSGYELFRDDEQVHGRLRLDVVDDDAALVLVFDLGGNLVIDDALEDGFHGEGFLQEVTEVTERRPTWVNPNVAWPLRNPIHFTGDAEDHRSAPGSMSFRQIFFTGGNGANGERLQVCARQDQSGDSVDESGHVEVDEKADGHVEELHMTKPYPCKS